jgi:4'-phosphopantetheinyl transferase
MTPADKATACHLPAPGNIHVWRIDLQHPALLDLGKRLLSADEAERARRLRFDEHRQRYMAGRSAMRMLLGKCTGSEPAAIRFHYGTHGKPALAATGSTPAVRFNFSNTDSRALLALAIDRDVGIDLESRQREINVPGLVRHILNDREAVEFYRLPEAARRLALLTIWTRKEAWIKALGAGFSRPLKSFSVSTDPGDSVQVLSMPEKCGEPPTDWTFRLLEAHPDDIATLTARGTDWSCRILDWQPDDHDRSGLS